MEAVLSFLIPLVIGYSLLMLLVFHVYNDAKKRYVGRLWPVGWAVACFLMLIIFFPGYLLWRPPVIFPDAPSLSMKRRIAIFFALPAGIGLLFLGFGISGLPG